MNLDATRMGHNNRIKNHLQGIAWVELRNYLKSAPPVSFKGNPSQLNPKANLLVYSKSLLPTFKKKLIILVLKDSQPRFRM